MANALQQEYWAGSAGLRWAAQADRIDRALAPVNGALQAVLAAQAGDVILDVGCGAGGLALALAEQAGHTGRVYAIDISRPLLDVAAVRGKNAIRPPHFIEADAQTAEWYRAHDAAVSRFGVMFFEDPVAAFGNIAAALKPHGRLAFACWQPLTANPWAQVMQPVIADIAPDQPVADPHAPGPFAFADPARVTAILGEAGFDEIAVSPFSFDMVTGEGAKALDESVDYYCNIGPCAAVLREADAQAQARAPDMMRRLLAPWLRENKVALPAAIWLVTARKAQA